MEAIAPDPDSADWLRDLRHEGASRDQAIARLHALLVRVARGVATRRRPTLPGRATEEIDLSAFNRGNYMATVESKNHSENVSRVLYPDDSTASGREQSWKYSPSTCSRSPAGRSVTGRKEAAMCPLFSRTRSDTFQRMPTAASVL